MILPSNNSLEELTRVFRLIQSGLGLGSSGNGVVGKDGKDGKNGKNGRDGQDGFPPNNPTLTGTTTVDQIQFDVANPVPAFSSGQMYWNAAEGTVDLNTDVAGTTLSLGQEQYVRVVNKTGAQINDGQVVYINDAQGNRPTIALAKADSISTCMVIGVATNNIADNTEGYVTTIGIVRGFNTSTFTDGDRLWLSASTAGAMTATPPAGNAYIVHVATALNSTVNGAIFVHPGEPVAVDPSFTADTDLAPPSQKATRDYVGHDITGEFTGFDTPENVTVSYDSTTRKVTLTGTVNAYYRGQKITALTNGWVSDAHPVATAPYFLYYDGSSFVWSTTPWTFDKVMICLAVWTSAGSFIYALRECHGLMQWQSHRELHETTGTYLKTGGDLSGYTMASTTAANRRPDISSTQVADEDLITTNATLTSKLYSIHNLTSTGTSVFTTGNAEILPVTGAQPFYNQFSSPNWVQTAVSNSQYTTAFCIAIPTTNEAASQNYRYLWIQGQSQGTLAQMQAVNFGDLNLGQLSNLTPEFVPIAKVIIRYLGANWTIEQVDKLTVSRVSGVSSSGNFLSAVSTDASLTGAGTAGSLLAVARTATVPLVDGTAAVGTADTSSRSDHVHPTDTSRAADSAVVHNTGNEAGLAGNKTWTGIANFSNSTASTTTTSGALVVTGGVGIGGAVNTGGNILVSYTTTGNVSVIAENLSTAANATAQLTARNDAGRNIRIQKASSNASSGLLTGGPTGEIGAIFTDSAHPLVLGTNVTAAITINGATQAVSMGALTATSGLFTGSVTIDVNSSPLDIKRSNNTSFQGVRFNTGAVQDFFIGLRETGDSNLHLYSYGTSGDVLVVAKATGAAAFTPTLAAGSYGVTVGGAPGAARDIFLAGQAGYSNGFTVQYNGSNMVYTMNNGPLTVNGALSASGAFGCNGNTAQGKYSVNAASTDLASVVALCNQLRAALIANGICV